MSAHSTMAATLDGTPALQALHERSSGEAGIVGAGTAPQAFIHYPRPAFVDNAYGFGPGMREFGSSERLPLTGDGARASVCVYRSGNCDAALLRVDIDHGTAVFGVSAIPTELRELAARLIDAAHDIEAHPARTLLQQHLGASTPAGQEVSA